MSNAEPFTRKVFKLPVGDGEIVLVNAADIEPEPVNWLWPYGLQLGVLNLVAGRPGGGKSTDGQACKQGRAVYWSGEDGIKDTLLPRFIAAGGARDNMSFVEGIRA